MDPSKCSSFLMCESDNEHKDRIAHKYFEVE